LYEILGNEAQLLKDELNTRQHIPRKVSKWVSKMLILW
jgi:hypothetical protein